MKYAQSALCWLLLVAGTSGLQRISDAGTAARGLAADRWHAVTHGIRVEQGCVELGLRHLKGDRAKVFSRLREWSEEALSRVTGCRGRYPMLDPYLDQWEALARRIRIRCLDVPYAGLDGFAAFSHGEYFEMSRSALYGVLAGRGGSNTDSGTWENKPFSHLVSWESTVDLFIHEVFHGTETNNRVDHNEIERVFPEQNGPCGEDVRMDRVCVVSNLCSGELMGAHRVEEALFRRMSHCGRARGCEDLFTGEAGNYGLLARLFGRSDSADHMSDRQSRELCEKIEDEGYCRHTVREQGETVVRADPRLAPFARLLRERLVAVVPASENMVPIAYVRSHPDLSAGYERVRGYECFRGIFSTAPSGNLFATVPGVARVAYPDPLDHFRDKGFKGHFENIREGVRQRVDGHVLCGDDAQREEILDWARDLANSYNVVEYSSTYRAAFARALGGAESQVDLLAGAWQEDDGFIGRQVKSLFGEELLRNYRRALRQYHPHSPHFRCDDAWFARTRPGR